jgi:putative transposase
VFTNGDNVELVKTQILRVATQNGFAVIAYCFMPDHLHLVVQGLRDDSDCLRFIKSAKQHSGFYFSQKHGEKLWQRYGFEHILRDDELALVVVRYVLENPVRAGLTSDPPEYPLLGSEVYSLEELLEAVADVGSA